MTPEEKRGRDLAHRASIGCLWFMIETVILAGLIRLAADGEFVGAWAAGAFLILLCYFEGRARK